MKEKSPIYFKEYLFNNRLIYGVLTPDHLLDSGEYLVEVIELYFDHSTEHYSMCSHNEYIDLRVDNILFISEPHYFEVASLFDYYNTSISVFDNSIKSYF